MDFGAKCKLGAQFLSSLPDDIQNKKKCKLLPSLIMPKGDRSVTEI